MDEFRSMERDNLMQANREAQRRAAITTNSQMTRAQQDLNNYANNSGGFSLYGSPDEISAQAANLSQVGAMTGQNLWTTGNQQQDYLSSLQARRNGEDATARRMLEQRNRNMANVGRAFSGRGVAGGVAASAMNTAQAQADSQIAQQQQDFAAENDKALWDYVKRNQKVTGEALAMGADRGLANQIDTDAGSGMSVICTELHRQGYISDEVIKKDTEFGKFLYFYDPCVLLGYQIWASHVATWMSKSKLLTKLIAPMGAAWAENIAETRPNFLGKFILAVGIPLCRVIGSFYAKKELKKKVA